MPRIHSFVPAGTILELGPGHGRWTSYLKELCDELILVDVSESCIAECQRRFAADANITYHVNDGVSLSAVPDGSVDFAFSFDSLVHAEADVLDSYARELARVLKPDGVGFIHHSNLGELRLGAALARRVPERWRWRLIVRGVLVNVSIWRATSTSARWFADRCAAAGLACIGQEKIAWEFGRYLVDAISLLTPQGSSLERPNFVLCNPDFMREARMVSHHSKLYLRPRLPRG